MTAVKKPRPKPAGGPIDLPDAISPDVYLRQFVDWLNVKPVEDSLVQDAPRTVRLRLVWLHAPDVDSEGVFRYGEIGHDDDSTATMTLGVAGTASDMKVFLKGTAALYSSGDRWGNAPAGELSFLPFPFNPNAAGEVTVTIWTLTGQIDLEFAAEGKNWTIQPTFEAGANLLSGFPSGAGAPSIKPLVLLSLSKHGV